MGGGGGGGGRAFWKSQALGELTDVFHATSAFQKGW